MEPLALRYVPFRLHELQQSRSSNPGLDVTKNIEDPTIQVQAARGNISKYFTCDPIDMISMLSQITIKVPLSDMFRIEK